MAHKSLPPEKLYTPCPIDRFSFKTTNDIEALSTMIGQDRAVAAVRFSIGMKSDGYNLFALGPEGVGKASLIRQSLKEAAATRPVPGDWCYVNNFADPQKPIALHTKTGRSRELRHDMEQLVSELKISIPAAFENDEYRNRKNAIEKDFDELREKTFKKLQKKAKSNNIVITQTPLGLTVAPKFNNEMVGRKEFDQLPKKEQAKKTNDLEKMRNELEAFLSDNPKLENKLRQKIHELNREVTAFAVDHLIEDLKEKWAEEEGVLRFLPSVREDILKNTDDFQMPEGQQNKIPGSSIFSGEQSFSRRYGVNILVDNADLKNGAPIIEEDHPTQPNLIGRIEHMSQFGTLVTDFNLILAGALHRANGGYLVMDARRLLTQPFAWETLMRELRAGKISIESPYESLGFASALSLQPEPIPLDVKVILTGEPIIYYLLSRFDPDFRELFKVAADFNTEMDRDEDAAMLYARLIASDVKNEGLLPLNRKAVARVIEYGARLAGDSEKLTVHMASIVSLVREASFWAGNDNKKTVDVKHVDQAIDAKIFRSDRIREYIQDEINNGTLLIETEGLRTGQINGLSVIQLDDFSFGRPSRISCTVRIGKGDVVDIDRQVELSGPLHAKGVMILSSFLGTRYARETPLSLTASLVFEQSCGEVEGDSASSAELYALLSALSEIPIKQSFAVTGSVDQIGRIQAIGGVNEKIEGFFDICKARGLDGTHGVLIPEANVRHLMLRHDVVKAVKRGDFHIHAVSTIDEGMEILTGVAAGEWDEKMGMYSLGSVNQMVETQLKNFAKKARETVFPHGINLIQNVLKNEK